MNDPTFKRTIGLCGDAFIWLISCEPTRTRCDWYPIKFAAKERL
jgi:hypothetical protein